jgi:Na+:H+ antiporter, NhaA family
VTAPPAVDPARDHVRGPETAPIVVLYGDYDDEFTRAACTTLNALEARVAFRHFPRGGLVAALAVEAAAELGAFWAMHDALLEHGRRPTAEDLRRLAGEIGLDPKQFEAAFGSDASMTRIREDLRGAVAAEVDDVPALFLDGERLSSYERGWLRERLATA